MSIWIRSQNKRILLNAVFFGIYGTAKIFAGNTIEGEGANGHFVVGEYESEERAIEIIDSIQQIAIASTIFQSPIMANRNMQISEIKPEEMVFQMPEK
jgi:hypothetical protein